MQVLVQSACLCMAAPLYLVQQTHVLNRRVASAQPRAQGALVCSVVAGVASIAGHYAVRRQCSMRQSARAPLAQVGRDAVRRVADEDDRWANELRAPNRATPAVPLAAHALLCNQRRPALRDTNG